LTAKFLIYAYDKTAAEKHRLAALLVRSLRQQGGAILSAQVLQEFYVNVTRKIPRLLSAARARGVVSAYCAWHLEQCTCETIMFAAEVQERQSTVMAGATGRSHCLIDTFKASDPIGSRHERDRPE
jgi:predicted nucleic acid-binding protein